MEEWAAESLLFALELVQIKHEYLKSHPINSTITNSLNSTPIALNKIHSREPTLTVDLRTAADNVNTADPEIELTHLDYNLSTDDDKKPNGYLQSGLSEIDVRSTPIPELKSISVKDQSRSVETHNHSREESISSMFQRRKASSVKYGTGTSSLIYNKDGSVFGHFMLPYGLPKSEILNKENRLIDRLYALYIKYIQVGAWNEINISAPTRNDIIDVIDGLSRNDDDKIEGEHEDLLNIMDVACTEVMYLLHYSFSRLSQTSRGQSVIIPILFA